MIRLAQLLVIALLATSCVGNKAYRVTYKPDGSPIIDATKSEKLPKKEFDCCENPELEFAYRLAFVEFDDRGEMFARGQLQQVVREIREVKRKAGQAGTNAVVAVFVHGWKNNASEKSGNVWGFRRMLALLAQQYRNSPVLGVYIGWRGAVVSAPVLKEFTFWDRRNKSQNLPNAHMAETLLSIMREAKGPEFTDKTISMFVGHSFGGGLLEAALTQSIQGLIVQTKPGDIIRWPANLIVFINQAAQATQSYQLIESLLVNVEHRPECGNDKSVRQPPVIVSVASRGDYATRAFFPFGQAVSRPFNSLRHYKAENGVGLKSQLPMFLNTTAHLNAFQSHLLDVDSAPEIVQAIQDKCFDLIETELSEGERKIKYKIVEKLGARNLSPYWVMHLPSSIVPDHSTIFGARFSKFLVTLLRSQEAAGPIEYRRLEEPPEPAKEITNGNEEK
jgi:hypothetical protein